MKRHSKVLYFSYGLVVFVGLISLTRLAGHLVLGPHVDPAAAERAPSRLRWLLTVEGERRGFAVISDLARDGEAWELWGPGPGMEPLNAIGELRPGAFFNTVSFGFNGGFWDERRQPVGVCAGERGIHSARPHSGGFAVAGGRAWIGPLSAHATLTPLSATTARTSATAELSLNPSPLPQNAPSLIDAAALAGATLPEAPPARVIWFDRAQEGPLRFNTVVDLTVRKVFRHLGGKRLEEPPKGTLELVEPERPDAPPQAPAGVHGKRRQEPPAPEPKPGDRYRLRLRLEPVRGVVRLATCAGPRLLKEGKMTEMVRQSIDSRAERTWRTAVGCDASGRRLVVLMLARGRDGLPGVTLRETAQTLLDLGATDALNLDGGSSSSVWADHLKSAMRPLFPLQSEIQHAIFLRRELPVTLTGAQ